MAEGFDVLMYREFASAGDYRIGQRTDDFGENLMVVAIGQPIHEGKRATIVLAHSDERMEEIQRFLDTAHASPSS